MLARLLLAMGVGVREKLHHETEAFLRSAPSLKRPMEKPFELGNPPKVGGPAVYVIRSGSVISAVGKSRKVVGRLSQLASLGTHRASPRIICMAYCTRKRPMVTIVERFPEMTKEEVLKDREDWWKKEFGDPVEPQRGYEQCLHGDKLRDDLIEVVGRETSEADVITVMFRVGEMLCLLFKERYRKAWEGIRFPPGPWEARARDLGWNILV